MLKYLIAFALAFTIHPTQAQQLTGQTVSTHAQQQKASMISVYKGKRLLVLRDHRGKPIRKYKIALGKAPKGHKKRRGDNKTPEGRYYIDGRNPDSRFHLSLKISYPNDRDWAHADRYGQSPGDMIMIHGLPNGKEWIKDVHKSKDWTEGCIALNNEEIREIWTMVDDGTPIHIWP